jgi:hypothetical protein
LFHYNFEVVYRAGFSVAAALVDLADNRMLGLITIGEAEAIVAYAYGVDHRNSHDARAIVV